MPDPTDFPYMLCEAAPWHPPTPPREADCPHVPEGERAVLLRPRSRADLLRAARPLAAEAAVRCLLLAPPEDVADLLPEDVRQWAAEAEDRLHRPVSLLMPGAPCPCGNAARCKGRTGTLLREQDLHLAGLGLRAESLSEALAEAFPHLTPRERELLHAWAHRPEPNHPRRPIFQTSLALAFKGNVRWVQRVLGRARADNPALFARLETLRNHRLRRTGAYEVPQG